MCAISYWTPSGRCLDYCKSILGAPQAYTHKHCSTAVLRMTQDAVQEAVPRLTQLDGAATAAIVLRFMPEAHAAVIHSLAATPDLQFRCALTPYKRVYNPTHCLPTRHDWARGKILLWGMSCGRGLVLIDATAQTFKLHYPRIWKNFYGSGKFYLAV